MIAWLKGEIVAEQVRRYLVLIEQVRAYEETRHASDRADWSFYLRMISLAYVLAREFNEFEGGISEEAELETWNSLSSQVTRMRGRFHLNPYRPDLSGTLNYPLFHLVEHEIEKAFDEEYRRAETSIKTIDAIGRLRAATLSYSLMVSPPLSSAKEQMELGDLLSEEYKLLMWLHGAFFLVHYEFLPDHFHRYAADWGEFSVQDPKHYLNLETGRKEYAELEEKLNKLFEIMKPKCIGYATKRMEPNVGINRIIGALGSHSD